MLDATLDHVAIAVRNIRASMGLVCDALGARFLFGGDVEEQGFRWAQFSFPRGGKIEFVTPIGDGFAQRFLDGRGEGVHHMTLKVRDIHAAIAHLGDRGVPLMRVSTGHADWKEAFIHPKDAHGALIQIAQSRLSDEELARHHLSDHAGAGHRHLLLEDL